MHGGDIYRNNILVDFSVNVNPLGVPIKVKKALSEAIEEVEHYPDLQSAQLKASIAGRFGLLPEQIICGNGASELILAVCSFVKPKKALLLAPSFSGYMSALYAVQSEIIYVPLKEEKGFALGEEILEQIEREMPDIFFLTNPNNPTGQLIPRELMRKVAKVCGGTGTFLVIDECFMELTGEADRYSFVEEMRRYEKTVILRAFTKSFAIPGVRLGYLLCHNSSQAGQIEGHLPEWNVSILAQRAGAAALQEENYLAEARELIGKERIYLIEELQKLGIKVYESQANYLLFYYKELGEAGKGSLYNLLKQRYILIRDCRDYEGLEAGYYRIAVRCHEDNKLLAAELKRVLSTERE